MYKHMLIGIDGRPGGREATALARTLSVLCPEADLTLGYVSIEPPFPSHGPASEVGPAVLQAELKQASIEADGVWTTASTVAAGFSKLVAETGADLLVLGSSHRGYVARVLLGATSRRTLDLRDTAVAVAPAGYDGSTPLQRLGIAHDGSPAAEEAFELARHLRQAGDARLACAIVISVQHVDWGQPIVDGVHQLAPSVFSDGEMDALHDEHIEIHLECGQPGPELAAFSQTVDLLVLGAPKRVQQHLTFGGSTAAYLASHCTCPLLIAAPRVSATTALAGSQGPDDEFQPLR